MSDATGGANGAASGPLLSVEGLVKHFKLDPKGLFDAPPILRAVDGVDFDVTRARRSASWANPAAESPRPRA